jgi:hypothetical protein
MSLPDERDIAAITWPDYPGERLIVYRNPSRGSAPATPWSLSLQPNAISSKSVPPLPR